MLLEHSGRIEEAEHWAARARTETQPNDIVDAGGLAALSALLAAHRGDETTALAEAKRAAEIAEATESFQLRATVRVATVRTLALLGRSDEARTAAHEAIAFLEAKGDLAWAARTRELLLEL